MSTYTKVLGEYMNDNYLYIFFDESGKSYDYKIDVIDAIDDRKNLKSPQY